MRFRRFLLARSLALRVRAVHIDACLTLTQGHIGFICLPSTALLLKSVANARAVTV